MAKDFRTQLRGKYLRLMSKGLGVFRAMLQEESSGRLCRMDWQTVGNDYGKIS